MNNSSIIIPTEQELKEASTKRQMVQPEQKQLSLGYRAGQQQVDRFELELSRARLFIIDEHGQLKPMTLFIEH